MKKFKAFFTALMILATTAAFAQKVTVKGTVTDSSTGEVIPFTSVVEKGTSNGVSSDADGKYSIAVSANGTLLISSVGYKSVEVAVKGQTSLNVALEPDSELLGETIVVAFGTSTKESFTGSAKVVKSEELEKAQVSAVTQALAGQVAGVQLTSSSGAPGSTPSIRIRGISSISAGKEPLYVVDGMPYDGDINNINPADVESMTVLKDAASNALYGARGANGVIMITTKRAKEREAIVTFDAKWGVNTRLKNDYEVITNPAQFYETHYAALNNYYLVNGYDAAGANRLANQVIVGQASGGGLAYQIYNVPKGELFIGLNGKLNPNATRGNIVTGPDGEKYYLDGEDWKSEGFRNSLRQEYNLSVTGGTDKINLYGSIGYLSNEGITANSNMKRFSSRLKAEYQAKKWLKIYGNLSYTKYDYNSLSDEGTSNSTGNIWAFTSQMAPIYPIFVRDENKNIKIDQNGFKMYDYGDGMNAGLVRPFMNQANPLLANQLNTINSEGNAISASGAADITFLKYFKFTFNASTTVDEYRGTSINNPYYGQFASSGGSVYKSHGRSVAFNTQQLLNYTQSFGKNNLNIMVGHEYYDDKGYGLSASKQMMFSQEDKELAGAVIDNQSAYSATSEYNTEGYLARAQYDFDSKIFASASFRYDASSRFHPEHRWGSFWSAGAAWIMSRENWFHASWVDLLKLKASYGQQGNDNIGSYRYTDVYDIVPSGGQVAVSFSSKGNEKISWEKVGNFNAGVEFELFKGILDGGFEYFYRKTTDMLFFFPVAISNGYSGYYNNVGDLYNSGIEFSLGANIINTKDIQWRINLNATHYKTMITYLHDDVKTLKVEGYDGYYSGSYFYGEGLPLYTRYLRKYAGVDAEGNSMWYKNTKDEEGKITGTETTTTYSEADYYLGEDPTPKLYGGFGTSLYLYGVDFSINCSYQIGGKSYDSGYSQFMSAPTSGSTGTNIHVDQLKAWTPENSKSDIPRFVYNDYYNAASSDRFLTDASYLSIENINLGYTLPSKWTKSFGVKSLRLYFAAENVGFISARKGFDPRYSFSGSTNYANYVPIRTFSGGITVKF